MKKLDFNLAFKFVIRRMNDLNIKYAEIIINNTNSNVDKPFTYIIGQDLIPLIKIGMRVIIPFGQGNKLIKGIVIDIVDEFHEEYKLKEIIDIIDEKPLISEDLIELSMWMREEYLSTSIESLRQIFPPGDFKKLNTFIKLEDKYPDISISDEEVDILKYLKNNKIALLDDLKLEFKGYSINGILNSMEEKNIISTYIDINSKVEKKYEKQVRLIRDDLKIDEIREIIGTRAKKQIEIAEYMYDIKEISFKNLSKALTTTLATVRALEEKEIIEIYEKEVNREAIKVDIARYEKHVLSEDQRGVYEDITCNFDRKEDNKFLIRGITGSGKTEIYLQLVEEMIKRGKQSIVLVPEISLTPQTIDRFVGRFGDAVAVIHSRLSHGERFDEWRKIKNGQVKIVVGARSAVFAPFQNLGLIVIDEEHESTYKSSQNPKYDTIEVAAKRVDIEDGFLVLGSATPSLETYHKAENGQIRLLELEHRANDSMLPQVDIIDMRQELNNGNKSMFSQDLYRSIEENLESEKQTILFLNRRGFSTFVSCRQCGYVVECEDCDISMTYHRNINKLRCHYCGLATSPPEVCPECGSNYIKYFGVGTEQVEQYTRKMFPDARVARMDFDTTSKKGSYDKILGAMKKGHIDILIGTQMISKGLDFKDVTLVGVIAADTSLNLPDFRAPERTFQLITQVAGRAGRGETPGKVIVQTYDPDHYSIVLSKDHDFKSFYENEIKLRESFMYPPFYSMINIVLYGENLKKVMKLAEDVHGLLRRESTQIEEDDKCKYIIGPNPAPLEKIKNNYRWHIILKAKKENIEAFKTILKRVLIYNEYKLDTKDIKISIDINPNSIL